MAEANDNVNALNENINVLNFSNIVVRLNPFNGKTNFNHFINQFNTRADRKLGRRK